MPQPDTSRRLQTRLILQDIDSMHGLHTIPEFTIGRAEATPKSLQEAYAVMQEKQQKETEMLMLQKAASDAARLAEWEFHNRVLAMKESVRGHFGPDSDEAQAVGYKKKSEHKRPRRRPAA
ncbi:MAG: hypothetical protein ACFE0J_04860 [Elainellaceae cyanobacterium]